MRVPSCFGSQVLVVVRKLRDPSLENRNGIAFFIALLCYVQSNKRTTQKGSSRASNYHHLFFPIKNALRQLPKACPCKLLAFIALHVVAFFIALLWYSLLAWYAYCFARSTAKQ